jgi:MerR family copper efflux transcriptional regulator
MNIGDVAQRTGLPAKTIRYYEDIGLITPDRDANGYRRFATTHLHKLGFLAHARSLGFSIEDCRDLAGPVGGSQPRLGGREGRGANGHLEEIDRKMTELTDMRATLSDLMSRPARVMTDPTARSSKTLRARPVNGSADPRLHLSRNTHFTRSVMRRGRGSMPRARRRHQRSRASFVASKNNGVVAIEGQAGAAAGFGARPGHGPPR